MFDANLLSGIAIHVAENLGSLVDCRLVELALNSEVDAFALKSC